METGSASRLVESPYPVFFKEFWSEGPWSITDHLVHITAVYECFITLIFCHYCVAFILVCQSIAAY